MKYYFSIQYRRLLRKFAALGVHPTIGLVLAVVIFGGVSLLLFFKVEEAKYVYGFVGIFLLSWISDKRRTGLIFSIFDKTTYYRIRIIENILMALPFIGFLVYFGSYLFALALLLFAIGFAMYRYGLSNSWVIPTPFKRLPFEFTVGFRKTFWLIAIGYFLLIQAIIVDNYNLGLAAVAEIVFVSMSYYAKPERSYFAWIFKRSPSSFLAYKLKVAAIAYTMLAVPALLTLFICFSEHILITVGVWAFGILFISTMILAKYSAFPREMNVPQALLFALSLWFPPMLFFIIPIFYKRSKKRLSPIL